MPNSLFTNYLIRTVPVNQMDGKQYIVHEIYQQDTISYGKTLRLFVGFDAFVLDEEFLEISCHMPVMQDAKFLL